MPGPHDHLTPWVGEREVDDSLRREEERETEQDRKRRTAEHGPEVSHWDIDKPCLNCGGRLYTDGRKVYCRGCGGTW